MTSSAPAPRAPPAWPTRRARWPTSGRRRSPARPRPPPSPRRAGRRGRRRRPRGRGRSGRGGAARRRQARRPRHRRAPGADLPGVTWRLAGRGIVDVPPFDARAVLLRGRRCRPRAQHPPRGR
jgi:hypothetical protein